MPKQKVDSYNPKHFSEDAEYVLLEATASINLLAEQLKDKASSDEINRTIHTFSEKLDALKTIMLELSSKLDEESTLTNKNYNSSVTSKLK